MSNEIVRSETQVTVFGVQARAHNVVQNTDTGRILNQVISVFGRPIQDYGTGASISVELRFDDSYRNGHESFAITAEVRRLGRRGVEACGCLHDDIARVFPELQPLIKWHLTSTDGPTHYVASTCYHAGDQDCNGLRKGERRPILGPDNVPTWVPKVTPERVKGHEQPAPVLVEYELWCREGEGKERDLDEARCTAVWPDATDEELCQERPQLEAALKARLPALLAEFKQAMLDVGFIYPEEKVHAD